jgi:hypothetical protein
MRIAAVMLAALVLAPALGAAERAVGPPSGLRGIVTRGPTKPVCSETETCEEPAVGIVLQFSHAGRTVTSVKTAAGGVYAVRLRPGLYAVRTPRPRVGTGLTPRLVRVPDGRVARVDFSLDTGIQ